MRITGGSSAKPATNICCRIASAFRRRCQLSWRTPASRAFPRRSWDSTGSPLRESAARALLKRRPPAFHSMLASGKGPDGESVIAALNPLEYVGGIRYDLSKTPPPPPAGSQPRENFRRGQWRYGLGFAPGAGRQSDWRLRRLSLHRYGRHRRRYRRRIDQVA